MRVKIRKPVGDCTVSASAEKKKSMDARGFVDTDTATGHHVLTLRNSHEIKFQKLESKCKHQGEISITLIPNPKLEGSQSTLTISVTE